MRKLTGEVIGSEIDSGVPNPDNTSNTNNQSKAKYKHQTQSLFSWHLEFGEREHRQDKDVDVTEAIYNCHNCQEHVLIDAMFVQYS